MESIASESLMELCLLLESSIDIQFQAWMAISFAVIVACYSAGDELETRIRIAISIIYSSAAYALFARWMTEVVRLQDLQLELVARGISFDAYWFAPPARMLTYILGSLITVGAVFYFKNKKTGKVDADT